MVKKLAVMMILVLGVLATACGDDDGGGATDAGKTDAGKDASN